MVKVIRLLYNSFKDEKYASKKAKVTQITQVKPLQSSKDSEHQKKSKVGVNDFFWTPAERSMQKDLSPKRGKSNKITNIVETAKH